MKLTVRFLCLALITAMLLSAIACGNSDQGNSDTTTTASTENGVTTSQSDAADSGTTGESTSSAAPTEKVDANGYILDDLDPSLNYGDKAFHILAWEHSLPEFAMEEQTGNVIDNAVYTRNANTEDRLGVDLQFTIIKGNSSAFQEFCQEVAKSVNAGDGSYDAIGCYLRSAGVMTLQHLLVDMLEVNHLDFDKPWWSDSLLELNTINNRLYFISGDIATTLLYQMMFMIYNNDLGEANKLTNPQEIAMEGKWTQEMLLTMSTDIYADLDNDGKKSEGDQFGLFSISHPNLDIFYMGADLHYVTPTESGDLILSPDVLGEKAMSIIDKFNDLYYTGNDGFYASKVSSTSIYGQGNSLFYNITGQLLSQNFRASDMNYSILPAPKYDEQQQDYLTAVAFTHTMYCIPIDAKDTAMSGAVLECMASEAYRNVTPALFETAFKYQYSNSQYDADMFEIVRDNVVFDICRPFFDSMGGDSSSPVRVWRNQITGGKNNLASAAKTYERVWVKTLQTISAELKETN